VPLFERCRGLLGRWPLTAAVTAVRVTVLLTAPLTGEQGNLLNTSWKDPGAADAALERVRAELGPDVVVTPASRDAYAPDRKGAWQEDGERPPSPDLAPPTSDAVASALRLLADPEKVDVDRDTAPRRIQWRGRTLSIASAIGPERLSGDWWNDGYSRDYWRCASDQELGELMLYRDAAGWWLQGWYD
jgi:protein ImuB